MTAWKETERPARKEEQEAVDNLPDGLRESERGQRMEEVAGVLEEAVSSLEELEASLEECKE